MKLIMLRRPNITSLKCMPYLTRTSEWFKFRLFRTNIVTSNSGHETTSGLLAFCVLELGDHPDIEER